MESHKAIGPEDADDSPSRIPPYSLPSSNLLEESNSMDRHQYLSIDAQFQADIDQAIGESLKESVSIRPSLTSSHSVPVDIGVNSSNPNVKSAQDPSFAPKVPAQTAPISSDGIKKEVPEAGESSAAGGHNAPQSPPKSPRDRVNELRIQLDRDVPLLSQDDADTLVFIDPPMKHPEQDAEEYKRYHDRHLKPHRVHSKYFQPIDSSYFQKAFGPTKQRRVQVKRRLLNNLPTGIKYVLDLTPPTEGDDAAYLMTELSCPLGARLWFQSQYIWDISSTLVGGLDEFEAPREDPSLSLQIDSPDKSKDNKESHIAKKDAKPVMSRKLNLEGELPRPPPSSPTDQDSNPSQRVSPKTPTKEEIKMPNAETPLDYSQVRHHSGVERVLHAICGLDPKLDSAPKIWTFYAVAKYFDCGNAACIVDWIVRWLYATPNSYFIELHPDITCRIADGLQCATLARDSFVILVGEEALDYLRRTRDREYQPGRWNSYGRMKDDMAEDDQTRVEYGSKAFIDRICQIFYDHVDNDMSWLLNSSEFRIVHDLESDDPSFMEIRQQLIDSLKDYVRGRLFWTLCRHYDGYLVHLKSSPSNAYNFQYPSANYMHVYNCLDIRERLFTCTAWTLLRAEDFSDGPSNVSTDGLHYSRPRLGWSALATKTQKDFGFKAVKKTDVLSKVMAFHRVQLEIQAAKAAERRQSQQAKGLLQMASISEPVKHVFTLPDRTRQLTTEDDTDLLKFENLTVGGPNLGDNETETRDKCRKISVTEEVAITPTSKDSSDQAPQFDLCNEQDSWGQSPRPYEPQQPIMRAEDRESLPSRYTESVHQSSAPAYVDNATQVSLPHTVLRVHPGYIDWQGENLTEREEVNDKHPENSTDRDRDEVDGKYPMFELARFFLQVNAYVKDLCNKMLAGPEGEDSLRLDLTDTLTCLTENELKYLPLWAGGNDDGSGGVFDTGVPCVDAGGFSAPGPNIRTGSVAPSEDSFEMLEGESSTGTRDTSTVAHDGFSDTLDRNRVYEADSLWDEVMASKSTDKAMDKGKAKALYGDEVETVLPIWTDGKSEKLVAADDDHWEEQAEFGSDIGVDEGEADAPLEDMDSDSDATETLNAALDDFDMISDSEAGKGKAVRDG